MTEAAHSTSAVHRRLVLGGMALGLAVMLLVSLAYRLGSHPLTRTAAVPTVASAPTMPPAGASGVAGRKNRRSGHGGRGRRAFYSRRLAQGI